MTYSTDSRAIRHVTVDSADALANKLGRVGFAVLMDESDPESFDIVPLGASKASVREFTPEELAVWNNPGPKANRIEEGDDPTKYTGNAKMALSPYEQVTERNFQRAAAQSHQVATAAGPPPTQRTLGVASDAALRAKQIADGAKERLARQQSMERNQRIADAQKAFWDKRKSA